MQLLQNEALISFLQFYGLFSLFATVSFLILIIKNYALHKKPFYSLKDIEKIYQLKEIENLKLNLDKLNKKIEDLQKENDDLSTIIINKIR